MGKLKYGIISPAHTKLAFSVETITTSTVLKAKSGRWMTKDTSANTWGVSAAASTQVDGYDDVIDDSTASGEKHAIYTDLNLVVEMPYYNGSSVSTSTLTAALLAADMGEVCDIYVASNIQYADITTASTKVLIVVGGDVDENTIYTKRNVTPATHYA